MTDHRVDAHADDGERIPGAAEFVEHYGDDDDAPVADALAAHMASAGLDAPASRGNIADAYRAIVQRIRGRRLVSDLGEHEFSVEWLGFHVPRGAKGQLKLSSSETIGYGVKLDVIGLGFGSGCRRTFMVNEDFRERAQCLTLERRVRARLRTFADRGKTNASYVQVDVLAVLAEERIAHDPCPECTDDADAYPLDQADPAFDLRRDAVGQVYQASVKLEGEANVDVGIPVVIPGLTLKPSVSIKRSVQLTCDIKYDLPGGYCYTPFHRADGWRGLPIWRRT